MRISEEEATKIHYTLVSFFKNEDDPISPPGIRDEGLLSSALHRPFINLGGIEKYKTNDLKAAALLHSLIKNHPFHNGNKRTALVICLLFYDKLGATIEAEENELYDFMINIAEGNINNINDKDDSDKFLLEISKWLRNHKVNFLKSHGDIKVKEFIKNCRRLGANIKEGDGYTISTQKDSIRIAKSTKRFESIIAKRYLSKLGLAERYSGINFDEFLSGAYDNDNAFKKIIPVLRMLSKV